MLDQVDTKVPYRQFVLQLIVLHAIATVENGKMDESYSIEWNKVMELEMNQEWM